MVKALNPFCKLGGRHRNFIEVHLAKSLRVGRECGTLLPHIVTTSYLTHDSIEQHLAREGNYRYPGPLLLSPGRIIGLRMVPMERDLRFAWEEMPQQMLDEQAQKVREGLHAALIEWAAQAGEGSDYTDNLPMQCLHPVGHWYEVPNLLRNGTLLPPAGRASAAELPVGPQHRHRRGGRRPRAPGPAHRHGRGAYHRSDRAPSGRSRRRTRSRGRAPAPGRRPGPAATTNSNRASRTTTAPRYWIDIDRLLDVFGLTRETLVDAARVNDAVRAVAARMPTYITLKDVKKRWGKGQEDVFPVAQFEKLWGDMTALPELHCRFVAVPRQRGQQLKEPAQLDGWLRDGSAAYTDSLCAWE